MRAIYLLLVISFFVAISVGASSQCYEENIVTTPVDINPQSFNEDIIAENSPAAKYSTTAIDSDGHLFYSKSFLKSKTSSYGGGLPGDRIIIHQNQPSMIYKLAPYNKLNAVKLSQFPSKILLSTSIKPSYLDLLVFSADGYSRINIQFELSDGSIINRGEATVEDWLSETPCFVASGLGRVQRTSWEFDGRPDNPKLFHINMDLRGSDGGAHLSIKSVIVRQVYGGQTYILAVSAARSFKNPHIEGQHYVFPYAKGIEYHVEPGKGSKYYWTVPEGAKIVSGQNTPSIKVDFAKKHDWPSYISVKGLTAGDAFNDSFFIETADPAPSCLPPIPKPVFFKGEAPKLWAIDGRVKDWESLFGEGTDDPYIPYTPPSGYLEPVSRASGNWYFDHDDLFEEDVCGKPRPPGNIKFSGFTYDDYNIYFYLRRLDTTSQPYSLYYFFDINTDGFMNYGEPVFHTTFSNGGIQQLYLSRYLPDTTRFYDRSKGNPLIPRAEDYENVTCYSNGGFPLIGKLDKVVSAQSIPKILKLKKNEVFDAATTENGYGVELSVPWRYIRNWGKNKYQLKYEQKLQELKEALRLAKQNHVLSPKLKRYLLHQIHLLEKQIEQAFELNSPKESKSLKAGEVFFYKMEMQADKGKYQPDAKMDIAAGCCGQPAMTGGANIKTNTSYSQIIPDSLYRINIMYKNLTNVKTNIGIEDILYNKESIFFTYSQPNYADLYLPTLAKLYPDYNCNGKVDNREHEIVYDHDDPPTLASIEGYGKACVIADLTSKSRYYPLQGVIDFESSVEFDANPDCRAGSKAINPVGRATTIIGGTGRIISSNDTSSSNLGGKEVVTDSQRKMDVIVYPNPNNGITNVILPFHAGAADIRLFDPSGRILQKWNSYKASVLQINNLKQGAYFLKVQFKSRVEVMKKIIVIQK